MAIVKAANISKDFNLSTKDVSAILKNNNIESTSIDDQGYALFIEALTTSHEIGNLEDYLSGKTKIKSGLTLNKEAPIATKVEKKEEVKAPVKEVKDTPKSEPRYTVPKQQNAQNNQNNQNNQNRQNKNFNQNKGDQRNNQGQNGQRTDFKRGPIDQAALQKKMEQFRQEQTSRPNAPLYKPGEEVTKTQEKAKQPTPNTVSTPAAERAKLQEQKQKTQEKQKQQIEVRNIKKNEPVDRFARFENKGQQNQTKQEKKKQDNKRDDRIIISGGASTQSSDPTVVSSTQKVRVVDTRTTQVDLSKYDDSYDNRYGNKQSDLQSNRQKLKKKDNNSQGKSAKDKEKAAQERIKKMQAELARQKQLEITVPDSISVIELASRMKKTSGEVLKKLMMMGCMVSVNDEIDYDTAFLVCEEFNIIVTKEVVVTIEEKLFEQEDETDDNLVERSPVVCVMGHVDHGKTSLLDAIRHTNVTSGEAGGITQHIGAYRVKINGKDITFLDTPGHEAFTTMRLRGAQATDIAILVVAADDGIMPQTVEAINHAKAAGIDIIVAINKMDKPQANPDQIMQGLTQYELVPEAWGGDVICCPVSAKTGMGIDELLENVLLVAEMRELKANPKRRAKGLVIESRLEKGRGPVATILVQNGTLHTGDVVIAGTSVGRVRAMVNERNEQLKEAGPSVPVEIIGLSEVPNSGDEFNAVEDEKMARNLADQRREKAKQEEFKAAARVNLDELFSQMAEGVQTLNVVVKADVAGSVEAVKQALDKLSSEAIRVKTIHSAPGGITESDVMLAAASNAIIVGFNVRPDRMALDSAERQGVDIRTYRVIYDMIDEISLAMKGMLAPTLKENLLGHAEVRQTIHVPNVGTIAGCYVLDGKIARHAKIRIVRDGVVIYEDEISSLKRFKDDVKEVAQGYECGVGLNSFNDIKVGDIFEAFIMEEVTEG